MALLSQDEAYRVISDVLKLDSSRERLQYDRMAFLKDLLRAYYREIPFQNIDLLCLGETERHCPTWEEVKAAVFDGRGGLCYTLGLFMERLLEALGYRVYLATSSMNGPPDNHITTIIRDLTAPGSLHWVDFSSYPTFEAVPLDFKTKSSLYHHSFLKYYYVREGNTIVRYHQSDGAAAGDCMYSGYRRVCVVDLKPRDISFFDESMHNVYTSPGTLSPFLVSLRAVQFVGPDLKMVAIKGTTLICEQRDSTLKSTELRSLAELLEAAQTYFPQFSGDDVARAATSINLYCDAA